ncbi:MAG: bifunctional DNA-binding transcriptional regulator/O6-methylguanine-DNA methyltransferase Ada [Chloroflexi bacterium]|nr:bifunctional DNA-binding transcriptional regulator/O6-methylguanine-DNA methyltransferase Ada [Chloroflexota bacterium]
MQNSDLYWQAVAGNDTAFDGVFVYAVGTTGVYCRPSCNSRRPLRRNVAFFGSPGEAEQAGFRACKRCQPHAAEPVDPQMTLVVAVCRYLEEPHERLPTLTALGARFAVSPYHLQRTFKRIVGISPRQYADAQRQARLKSALHGETRVTDALYAAGYETSSSLYEHVDDVLGMTPVIYRERGKTMNIHYTIAASRLGALLVAATDRGVCKVSLGDNGDELVRDLRAEFTQATITHHPAALGDWVNALVAYVEGQSVDLPVPLDIQATAFQRQVWEALRAIPYGQTRTYSQIAEAIGQPTAARAVAAACAANPVAVAIPCHRVVRADGGLSGYRWGIERKRALLTQEAANSQP